MIGRSIKKKRLLDLFIISNYAFLSIDILYAHSVNQFAHGAEYLPLAFSPVAALVLAVGFVLPAWIKGFLSTSVGVASVVLGATGIYFHLASQFFKSHTLASLTYTAPLVAPLAYSALGLLLFLNCFVSSVGRAWGAWVYFLAYLGFVGNFVLGLCDHYQNQFYYSTEWIPVVSASLVVGVAPFYLARRLGAMIRPATWALVGLQILVGLTGFALHLYGILVHGTSPRLVDRFLYGPPLLAPLLFANLALLLAVGILSLETEGKILKF